MSDQLKVTVSDLNVRDAPSADGSIVGHLSQGDVVDWLDTSADGSWRQIQKDGLTGWSAQQFLAPVAPPTPTSLDPIIQIAAGSAISGYSWNNRGVAPIGYIKGMALVYGRVYCKFKSGDPCALEMAKASTGDGSVDALAWLAAEFTAIGLRNLRTHWGPINSKTAEIKPDCDTLLQQVQQAVDASDLCSALS